MGFAVTHGTRIAAPNPSGCRCRLRPGIHHLKRLLDHGQFRLGIYTSATVRTAHRAIDMIEKALNQHVLGAEVAASGPDGQSYIQPFELVLHR